MAYAYLQVDLDEVETSDLIEELDNRYLVVSEQEELLSLIKHSRLHIDAQKISMFLKVMDKFSLQELADLFKEDITTPIPENQLSLNL
jgi:hypothetical protein